MLHKEGLRELETLLQKPIFTDVDDEGRRILTSHIEEGKLLAKMYRMMCFLTILLYMLFPVLDKSFEREHKFPLRCWFPFNEENYYYQVVFVEVLSIAISAIINSSMDILTIMMMIVATAEFKILNRKLTNILVPSGSEEAIVEDVLVKGRLEECIVHYDELLQ